MGELVDAVAKHWESIATLSGAAAALYHFVLREAGSVRRFFVRAIETMDKVETISKALGPNGGSSLADSIRRQEGLLRLTSARVTAVQDASARPSFEADLRGELIAANTAMVELLGRQTVDLLGKGFLSAVIDADRDKFEHEWFRAVTDARTFDMTIRCEVDGGSIAKVRIIARPTRDQESRKVLGFWGAFDFLATVSA